MNNTKSLPVEIVFQPSWWFHHEGLTFDEDFFFHPLKRVEAERKMEKALYDRWGQYGFGCDKDKDLPLIGATHLAAGFLLSEMLGCHVEYKQDTPPQVVPAHFEKLSVSADKAFQTNAFKKLENLVESLKKSYGYVTGDVNWGGILNLALDLRGDIFFIDLFDNPQDSIKFLSEINNVIEQFTDYMLYNTGSTSISVNRNVHNFDKRVFLHSECSHTMISVEDYEKYLQPFDIKWSQKYQPYGIHYCGPDPDRYAESFAKIPQLHFLDVGWGGDIAALRKHLPNTFLNIRLSPVDIVNQSEEEIRTSIIERVTASGNLELTGVCCINMDEHITDNKVTTILETVRDLWQA